MNLTGDCEPWNCQIYENQSVCFLLNQLSIVYYESVYINNQKSRKYKRENNRFYL